MTPLIAEKGWTMTTKLDVVESRIKETLKEEKQTMKDNYEQWGEQDYYICKGWIEALEFSLKIIDYARHEALKEQKV